MNRLRLVYTLLQRKVASLKKRMSSVEMKGKEQCELSSASKINNVLYECLCCGFCDVAKLCSECDKQQNLEQQHVHSTIKGHSLHEIYLCKLREATFGHKIASHYFSLLLVTANNQLTTNPEDENMPLLGSRPVCRHLVSFPCPSSHSRTYTFTSVIT